MPGVERAYTVDRALVRGLKNREDARFRAEHPRAAELLERGRRVMPNGVPMAWHRGSHHHPPPWAVEGHGACFTDVDGFTYADFNIADMSMFTGYAPEPLVRAVADRMAHGHQFLLPTGDAIVVSEELAARFGLPLWQYTLSASQANTEAIRVARVMTGRDRVLFFDGKYLGHFDQALVELGPDGTVVPEERGLPRDVVRQAAIVPFNDESALAAALARREIAVVLTAPAMTNNFGLILPAPGFHDALRRLTRETGTLLAIDETHTQVVGASTWWRPAGRSSAVASAGRPWHIYQLGPRAGCTFRQQPVTNAAEARACADDLLVRLIRIWLANRGVWEAILGAGPLVPVPAGDGDVDRNVAAWNELLAALAA